MTGAGRRFHRQGIIQDALGRREVAQRMQRQDQAEHGHAARIGVLLRQVVESLLRRLLGEPGFVHSIPVLAPQRLHIAAQQRSIKRADHGTGRL